MGNPRTPFRSVSSALVLLVCLAFWGCGSNQDEETVFQASGDTLYRDSQPFTLRAVESSEIGDPGISILVKAEILNRICGAGANAVVVGLPEVECITGSPVSLWLSELAALKVETGKRSMGLILKVDSDCKVLTEDLVNYLLTAVGDSRSILLWIDGARAADTLRRLKEKGSRNVLMGNAPAADIPVAISREGGEKPSVISLDPVDLSKDGGHFILSDQDGVWGRLEAVFGGQSPVYVGQSDEEGFLPLFNGSGLEGWKATRDPTGWAVEEGAIVWKHAGGGRLQTLSRYSDFVLRLEWKIGEGCNSGLFIRCPAAGRESRIGMELQLYGDYGKPSTRNGTASIYDVVAPSRNASLPPDQWNQMEVECRGANLRVTLNGTPVQDCNFDSIPELKVRLRSGFIALQDHGDPVAFRNIRIKPL